MNSPLCVACAMAERRAESGFCSDRCALHFGYAMQDHTDPSLHNNGMIKLCQSNYISMAIKSTPKLGEALRNYEHADGGHVLPQHAVYSLGARLYHIGVKREGEKGRKESKSKRAKEKAKAHLGAVTNPSDAREIAEAALRRATELEAAQAVTLSAAAASALAAPPPLPALTYSPPPTSLSMPTKATAGLPALMSSSSSPVPYGMPTPGRGLIQRAESFVRMTEQRLREMAGGGALGGTYFVSVPKDIFDEILKYIERGRPVVRQPERLRYVKKTDMHEQIEQACFAPNGDIVILTSQTKELLLCSAADGRVKIRYGTASEREFRPKFVKVDRRGQVYTSHVRQNAIEVWSSDAATKRLIQTTGPVICIALNAEETKIFVLQRDEEIHVYSITEERFGEPVEEGWQLYAPESYGAVSMGVFSDESGVIGYVIDQLRAFVLWSSVTKKISGKWEMHVKAYPNIVIDGSDTVFCPNGASYSPSYIYSKEGIEIGTFGLLPDGIYVHAKVCLLHPDGMIALGGFDNAIYYFSSSS